MENSNMFAQRLKQVREEKKMTQKTFSEFLEIKQQTLSGYETGKISPSLDLAANMSRKLKVSLDWLCGISNERVNASKQVDHCYMIINNNKIIFEKINYDSNMKSNYDGTRYKLRLGTILDDVAFPNINEYSEVVE